MDNVLIGIGTGGWSYAHNRFDFRDYPHNIFLEIGSELGLLGLIIFCTFLWFIYRDLISAIVTKNKNSAIYLFAVWGFGVTLVGFFNAQVSGDIFGNEYLWVGAAILSKLATWVDIRKNFNKMMAFNRIVDTGQDFHQSKLTENPTHR
jgi:O-antigen ligase